MEKTNKLTQMLSLLFVFALLTVGIVTAASSDPSNPTGIGVLSNTTNSYPNGTMLNGTRGYIYTLQLNESQPTQKWVGYVGNIVGEYALQDADGDALYDWDIATVTGEVYATKEGAYVSTYDNLRRDAGGIPVWSNLSCAIASMVTTEAQLFNHTSTQEDAYTNTFKTTGFTNPGFYAGEKQVTDTTMWSGGGNCYGVHLNQNNADEPDGGNWSEVVLTDGTFQAKSAAEDTVYYYDIIYGALIENSTAGYDGNDYDFQILLPQSGLEGSQSNVAFYFYVELI
ncbi:hypothetical protein ACFLZ6_02505 [Nanoarchaeota archaeon]